MASNAEPQGLEIRTVLCPVDFSPLTEVERCLAVEVCAAFGARLVLHHNVAGAVPGFAKAWEWDEVHRTEASAEAAAEARLEALRATLPPDLEVETLVSSGPVAAVVLQLAESLPADLVVLGSHGWSTPEHASVTDRLLAALPCPALTLHADGTAATRFHLRAAPGEPPIPVLVPTDFSETAETAVAYAIALARRCPLELAFLHVLPDGAPVKVHPGARPEPEAALERLRELVPPDLTERVRCAVEEGPAAETIAAYAARTNPSFLVMGEHARSLLRRFFTRDTALAVARRVRAPVWFVPAKGRGGRPA